MELRVQAPLFAPPDITLGQGGAHSYSSPRGPRGHHVRVVLLLLSGSEKSYIFTGPLPPPQEGQGGMPCHFQVGVEIQDPMCHMTSNDGGGEVMWTLVTTGLATHSAFPDTTP